MQAQSNPCKVLLAFWLPSCSYFAGFFWRLHTEVPALFWKTRLSKYVCKLLLLRTLPQTNTNHSMHTDWNCSSSSYSLNYVFDAFIYNLQRLLFNAICCLNLLNQLAHKQIARKYYKQVYTCLAIFFHCFDDGLTFQDLMHFHSRSFHWTLVLSISKVTSRMVIPCHWHISNLIGSLALKFMCTWMLIFVLIWFWRFRCCWRFRDLCFNLRRTVYSYCISSNWVHFIVLILLGVG